MSDLYPIKSAGCFIAVMAVALVRLRAHHPFARFGPANQVTTVRALLVALVAGCIGEVQTPSAAGAAIVGAATATILDGADGWLARRTGMVSAFGARFDMEVDALLIQVLALLAWQWNKAGVWVLTSGLLRYVFVLAGRLRPWMRRPLRPTLRAKSICVLQIASLIVVIVPAVHPPVSAIIAALGLSALAWSFFVDTRSLWIEAGRGPEGPHYIGTANSGPEGPHYVGTGSGEAEAVHDRGTSTADLIGRGAHDLNMRRRLPGLIVALFFLDASVTFGNVWPTPGIAWRGDVSIELAACLMALAFAVLRRRVSLTALRCLSALWTMLVIGRYAEATAPALYGRDINLYWDLRFVPDVVRMVVRVAPVWLIVVSLAAGAAVFLLLYTLVSRAWRAVAAAVADPPARRAIVALSAAVILACIGRLATGRTVFQRPFAQPVALTYARQVELVAESRSGPAGIGPSPVMSSDLSRVRGADVLLIFVESYGAISFERSDVADHIAGARRQLESVLETTGREAVSAYVDSPTFGGSSWLAHITLMSGLDVRDQRTNTRLMSERRDTIVRAFAQHGFRTVALMPGLRQSWPEGAFYGFDDIYGAQQLAYHGPEFGWFAIPDQYSLERLDRLEAARASRAPLFLFFPTLSTHFPFNPTPPYQPDWTRVASGQPFDGPAIVRAYAREPDWINFTPGYVDALTYELETFAGYLQKHRNRDLVMILVGDHQPPALVSGQGASWSVPVHVIASRRSILDRLVERGFRRGLRPRNPSLGGMHTLLPILLDTFGDPE